MSVLTEYGRICGWNFERDKKLGYLYDRDLFEELAEFIENAPHDSLSEALKLVRYKGSNSGHIELQSYVGTIALGSGKTIDILPKLFKRTSEYRSEDDFRELVVRMLKTVNELPLKKLPLKSSQIEDMNIFEAVIGLYADEVFELLKHGLRCSYETVRGNERFLKGKLLFSENIRHNLVHKERFYVEYDTFNINRPENKIIKRTLGELYKKSRFSENKSRLRTLLEVFSEVDTSNDPLRDLGNITRDRNARDYDTLMELSRAILNNSSIGGSGDDVNITLLYPMEKLYESYIGELIESSPYALKFEIYTQHSGTSLFDSVNGSGYLTNFNLRPDFCLKHKKSGNIFILDTKWKLLDREKKDYGISTEDMYQMFAYSCRFRAKSAALLYPENSRAAESVDYKGEYNISARFIDMFDAQESVDSILKNLLEEC